METFLTLLFSSHTLAFLVPFMVFMVTIFLVVRKLIGFLMTVAFLAFSLVAGVVIANYDIFKEYLPKEDRDKISQVERMLKGFKSDIERAFNELHEDFREERQSLRRFSLTTRDLLDELDEHTNTLRHFVQDTVKPTLDIAGRIQPVAPTQESVEKQLEIPEELRDLQDTNDSALTFELTE